MMIRDISWRPYRVPLRDHFATAHGAMQWREGIIVEIVTAQGITGIGEIAPLLEFGRSVSDALALLPELAAALCKLTVEDALALLDNNKNPTTGGMEMALLDALGKERGVSVGVLLAPPNVEPRASVRVNAVIGALDAETATQAARQATTAGYRCIKLKVGMEQDAESEIARIVRVREAIGVDVALRLDANEAWDVERASAVLSRCMVYNIQYVEQPLPRANLEGLRALQAAADIPIAVDEALNSLDSARALLAIHAADVFVIKPQIVGGLRVTRQIIDEAATSGVQCVISSAIESGIGLSALLHLVAAAPAVTLQCGLATADLLADDLIVEALPIINGEMAVPHGPGLGVTIDEEAMKGYGYDK